MNNFTANKLSVVFSRVAAKNVGGVGFAQLTKPLVSANSARESMLVKSVIGTGPKPLDRRKKKGDYSLTENTPAHRKINLGGPVVADAIP
jgi:hypothetical protein